VQASLTAAEAFEARGLTLGDLPRAPELEETVLDQNGVTPQELSEVVLHVTFYGGWPAAVNAGRLLTAALRARDVELADLK
jgi:hypothetical protein